MKKGLSDFAQTLHCRQEKCSIFGYINRDIFRIEYNKSFSESSLVYFRKEISKTGNLQFITCQAENSTVDVAAKVCFQRGVR